MTSKHVEPALGAESFSCPHCGAIAHQTWFRLFLSALAKDFRLNVLRPADLADLIRPRDDDDDGINSNIAAFITRLERHEVTYSRENSENLKNSLVNVATSKCYSCDGFSLWVEDKLIYPANDSVIIPHEEMPDSIKADFNEAASIVDRSPRGAAALLRLCIQKIMPDLGATGDNLNDNIASLVKKGMEPDIKQAMDVLRVIGNNAVHPGQIDLKDDKATAIKLFDLMNLIVERRIATPNKIKGLFEGLPQSALKQIEKRDKE